MSRAGEGNQKQVRPFLFILEVARSEARQFRKRG
jgi:hypothetical protein